MSDNNNADDDDSGNANDNGTDNDMEGEGSVQNKFHTRTWVRSALFLSLALVLPFLTGQIPQVGRMLCPMHIPVILCGYICGPAYALIVGLVAPILRFLVFGSPMIFPSGVAMSFELAVYGLTSGLFYRLLPHNKKSVYLSLVLAMLSGRLCWGIVMKTICLVGHSSFTWGAFGIGAFANALPGILVQLILIPLLVFKFGLQK